MDGEESSDNYIMMNLIYLWFIGAAIIKMCKVSHHIRCTTFEHIPSMVNNMVIISQGHVTFVAMMGTVSLVANHLFNSYQLIWR